MKLPQKQTIETVKSIVIAILVTGIVSFVAGAKWDSMQTSLVHAQAVNLVSSLKR